MNKLSDRTALEYLGYWITQDGVQPLQKKVTAILNMQIPTNKREVRHFIGMINYNRDMQIRRSEILAPLTKLCSKNNKFVWTEEQTNAFHKIKQIICEETLLAYPDFSQPFEIHTDSSKVQLGSVTAQKDIPIAFYSRKLTPAQTRYTTTERELLTIVETLKKIKYITWTKHNDVY